MLVKPSVAYAILSYIGYTIIAISLVVAIATLQPFKRESLSISRDIAGMTVWKYSNERVERFTPLVYVPGSSIKSVSIMAQSRSFSAFFRTVFEIKPRPSDEVLNGLLLLVTGDQRKQGIAPHHPVWVIEGADNFDVVQTLANREGSYLGTIVWLVNAGEPTARKISGTGDATTSNTTTRLFVLNLSAGDPAGIGDLVAQLRIVKTTLVRVPTVITPDEHRLFSRYLAEFCGNACGSELPRSPNPSWPGFVSISSLTWIVLMVTAMPMIITCVRRFRGSPPDGVPGITYLCWLLGCGAAVVLIVVGNAPGSSPHEIWLARLRYSDDLIGRAIFFRAEHQLEDTPLHAICDYVESAEQVTRYFGHRVDPNRYSEMILNPEISPRHRIEMNFRRTLWEVFRPRVRTITDTSAAARYVQNVLRSHITVSERAPAGQTMAVAWLNGAATPALYEIIYVASLRSVGILAKLDVDGRAVFYEGDRLLYRPQDRFERTLSPKVIRNIIDRL